MYMQFDKLTVGINFISMEKQSFHIDLKINPVDIKHESSFSLLTDIFYTCVSSISKHKNDQFSTVSRKTIVNAVNRLRRQIICRL